MGVDELIGPGGECQGSFPTITIHNPNFVRRGLSALSQLDKPPRSACACTQAVHTHISYDCTRAKHNYDPCYAVGIPVVRAAVGDVVGAAVGELVPPVTAARIIESNTQSIHQLVSFSPPKSHVSHASLARETVQGLPFV